MTDTYPLDVEPWEQNISTRINFTSKWEDMLAQGTPVPTPSSESGTYPVGVYEGAGYSAKASTVRQTIAACVPMNIPLSVLSANELSAASLNFIQNKNKLNLKNL